MLNSQIEELGTIPFSEEMVISKMLSNLPTAYDTFQTMWKTVAPEQQTLTNLQTWLLDEERAIRKRQSENAHSHILAFYSRSSRASGNPGRYRPSFPVGGSMNAPAFDGHRAPRPFLPHEQYDSPSQRAQEIATRKQVSRYGNCGEIGHWHKDCLRPPRKHVPVRHVLHSPATEQHTSSAFGASSPPQDSRYSTRSPHVTMTSPRAYMVQFLDQEVQPTDWLADNGSSHHMTDQSSWFTNFTAVPAGTWPVQAVDGHTTFVEGTSDIPIDIYIRKQWERDMLTDVLYVPTIQRNFFSVSSAAFKNIDTLTLRKVARC